MDIYCRIANIVIDLYYILKMYSADMMIKIS
jgi:hypothetical protein